MAKWRKQLIEVGLMFMAWGAGCAVSADNDYLDVPLEQLLDMEVTSVARKSQRIEDVAAAVFVITGEEIRRSGVTSIPEALRLAPGIQVARIDANKWAITSRGFNNQYATKLLVMIDGRTVYSPSFSGVYWDVQDTLLDDIDRIEVIRGPGAAIWGANAVNGVINIITKPALATQGTFFTARAGTEDRALVGFRHGMALGERAHGRVYVKYSERDDSWSPVTSGDAGDSSRSLQGGFRVDGVTAGELSWTFQGDVYRVDENQRLNLWMDPDDPANAALAPNYLLTSTPTEVKASGWNLLGRWERQLDDGGSWQLQIYWDHTDRDEATVGQLHDTLDLDFQHQIHLGERHELIWGAGYRRIWDDFDDRFAISLIPNSRATNLYSLFVQDEISLVPRRFKLILGSKFEHNDYTGFEIQPSARLLWNLDANNALWMAVSRAARTPSRSERHVFMVGQITPAMPPSISEPIVSHLRGNEDFDSEHLVAWEIGYRSQPLDTLSFDITVFHNQYDNLRSFMLIYTEEGWPGLTYANEVSANSRGVELVVDWWILEWWHLQGNYSYLTVSAHHEDPQVDPVRNDLLMEASAPSHQVSLRSTMEFSPSLSLDLWLLGTSELERTSFTGPEEPIPAWVDLNVRLGWRPQPGLELSLVGQNLFDNHHPEFIGEDDFDPTEVERAFYGQVRWSF